MTDIKSNTPLADALAEVDKAAADNGYTSEGEARPHLSRALWHLAEAVRVSLGTFSEGDVRTLASAAMELWNAADRPDENRILSASQRTALGKADAMFGTASA